LSQTLYRSRDLLVRRVAAADMRRQVVTFDHYHGEDHFDRLAFGEAYLAANGIGAVHVLSRGNDWFHHADMDRALAAVHEAVAGAERVLAYGSSMGGYGAIRFADAIGAHAAP
jgi:hypothetical protein